MLLLGTSELHRTGTANSNCKALQKPLVEPPEVYRTDVEERAASSTHDVLHRDIKDSANEVQDGLGGNSNGSPKIIAERAGEVCLLRLRLLRGTGSQTERALGGVRTLASCRGT